MKPKDIIVIALLALNLVFMATRDDGAHAASRPRKTERQVFMSGSERSLPVLHDIRDVLKEIDQKLGTLVQLQTDLAKSKR